MVKMLALAVKKASSLSEAAQEQIGRELLERVETFEQLRTKIEIGITELDAGLGESLDVDAVILQARNGHEA